MQNAVNKEGRAGVSYLDCGQHGLSHWLTKSDLYCSIDVLEVESLLAI